MGLNVLGKYSILIMRGVGIFSEYISLLVSWFFLQLVRLSRRAS